MEPAGTSTEPELDSTQPEVDSTQPEEETDSQNFTGLTREATDLELNDDDDEDGNKNKSTTIATSDSPKKTKKTGLSSSKNDKILSGSSSSSKKSKDKSPRETDTDNDGRKKSSSSSSLQESGNSSSSPKKTLTESGKRKKSLEESDSKSKKKKKKSKKDSDESDTSEDSSNDKDDDVDVKPPKKKFKKVAVRPPFFNSRGRTANKARDSIEDMKKIQQKQLQKFRKHAESGNWKRIHADHYDWFMFPIEDGSMSEYNVLKDDVEELKSDPEWMAGYKEAVELVSKAWGWDVNNACTFEPPELGMGWTHWDVRLAKIIRSLWIFGQKHYMESMQKFAEHVKPNHGLFFILWWWITIPYMFCSF
eukprot:TRINITY_DN3794_c0_g1_i4.p1 TRINITY_DN3794_c0_g1~~TRINITY_DN3794_c0_g1_i4.p1  ORF type:complete len:363 (+),score=121.11 TRINITY_DN3794_c0_g1_i4:105-1193(+)